MGEQLKMFPSNDEENNKIRSFILSDENHEVGVQLAIGQNYDRYLFLLDMLNYKISKICDIKWVHAMGEVPAVTLVDFIFLGRFRIEINEYHAEYFELEIRDVINFDNPKLVFCGKFYEWGENDTFKNLKLYSNLQRYMSENMQSVRNILK